ncbi:cytochrome P450 [Persicimonas caeni]|uniref:cytochrome P450 n=1 Tax=Persicimonas caeni TaxID=2292766 RepID=UPI001C9A3018|nr:cytochrome P450 [Persicimonas caeni]
MHDYPRQAVDLRDADDDALELFAHEVRRFYPFFPFVAAIVRRNFTWRGYEFEEGTRTLLDLYGTNRDPRVWDAPDTFRPERFRDWDESPFNFIPQDGGDFLHNHRCAGEWITKELMEAAVDFLVHSIDYEVPAQDLSVDLSRMPAIPASCFRITNVRRVH